MAGTTNNGETKMEVDEDALKEKAVDEDALKEKAVDANVPKEEIVDRDSPFKEIVDEDSSFKEIVDEDSPFEEIVDEDSSFEEIVDEYIPKEEAVNKNAPHKVAVDENAPNKEAVDENAPNKEVLYENAPNKEAVNENAPNKEAVDEDPTKEEVVDENALNEEAVDENAPSKEAVDENAPNKEAVDENATNKEALYENAPNKEAVDEDPTKEETVDENMTNKEAVDEDPTKEETVDENALNKEAVDEDPTIEEAVDENAPNKEAVDEDPTKEEVVDENALIEEAVDENAPSKEAVDEDPTKEEAVDENIPKEEAVYENIPNKNIVEESLFEEVWNEYALNKEVVDENAPNKEVVYENAPNKEAVYENAPNKEVVDENAPNKEAVYENAPNKEAVDENAPNKEAVDENAPNKEAVDENAPNKEAVDEESLFEEIWNEYAPKEEAFDENAPNEEIVNKNRLKEMALNDLLKLLRLNKSLLNEEEVDEYSTKEDAVNAIQYPPPSKSGEILEKMHASREHGEFCDLQLKISSVKTVFAHKALLANSSQYFEGVFSSTFMEDTSKVIDLSHMCDRSEVLEKVLDTFYGRSFEINESNVFDTLNLAFILMLKDLKGECTKVLLRVVSLYNAVEMLQLAVNYDLQDLQEKVEPIIRARFNDYIIFQEDLFGLCVEGFDSLTDIIETKFITRGERYIQFLFKWFSLCKSEERAQLLLKAINKIHFKLTKHSYVEYKDQLEDFLNNLHDVKTDMSEQTKVQLSSKSLDLIPADYVQNVPLSTDSCNSDVEPEPEFEMWPELPEGEVAKYFGPPTREVGFTQKEEQEWEKAHEKMAERDSARELVEKWPAHSRKDNIRPKGYESPPTARRNRVFPKKSEEEQKRLNDMVDVVVVLTPSASYLDRLQNPPPKPKKKSHEAEIEPDDNMLAVCVYVPCTRGWYKITELNTTCVKNAFGGNSSISSGDVRSGASSWDDPFRDDFDDDDDDDDDDDEEEQEMMMMMDDMYTFNEKPHSRMPQSTSLADKKWKIPSLADKKWKVQYYMDKLFFFHEKLLFCVYIYDLLTKEWKQTHVDNRSAKPERSYVELLDGLDLIVLNKDTMYAVQRIALIEKNQQKYPYFFYNEMVHSQTLKVKHIVYKLVEDGEKKDMRWEWHMDTDKHFVHIVWDRDYQRNIKKDDNRMAALMALYQNRSPRLRKPNCLETALFAEDPFKLDIVYMTHGGYNNYASNIKSACAIEACYLDTKKTEELPVSGGHNSFMFGRTVTPLVSSDYCIFTSDLLEPVASIDLAHGSNMSSWLREPDYPSAFSPYLKALEQYPRCSTTMCSAKDGKRLWILRGKEDDSSELIEVQIKSWRQVCLNRSEYVQTPHTPPPFKCFTMATTGSMDIARLKDFGLPMKYMHDRLNVL